MPYHHRGHYRPLSSSVNRKVRGRPCDCVIRLIQRKSAFAATEWCIPRTDKNGSTDFIIAVDDGSVFRQRRDSVVDITARRHVHPRCVDLLQQHIHTQRCNCQSSVAVDAFAEKRCNLVPLILHSSFPVTLRKVQCAFLRESTWCNASREIVKFVCRIKKIYLLYIYV